MSYINKEQAIDLIESMIADKGVAFNPHKLAMALKDMESVAIPEAKDTDLISRQAAIEALRNIKAIVRPISESDDVFLIDKAEAMTELMMLPSAQPEKRTDKSTETHGVCSDCISRQAAIEALMAHFIPQAYTGEQVEQAEKLAQKIMNEVPPVEPTLKDLKKPNKSCKVESVEPKPVCEDAISRNWILRTLETWQKVSDYNEAEQNIISAAICEVKDAPPVEPERPKGRWVFDTELPAGGGRESAGYFCSICGADFFKTDSMNFCPNCGADMRGEKHD